MTIDESSVSRTATQVNAEVEIDEHFKPTGTLFILALFVVALILLWFSVFVILWSRGVTV